MTVFDDRPAHENPVLPDIEWPWTGCEDLARASESFETPPWAVEAILAVEPLTRTVIDPCCGTGVLAKAADAMGHRTFAMDKYSWGYGSTGQDFLEENYLWKEIPGATVLMNPPFSLATDFVEKAFECGAKKIICFQRFAWYESARRRGFWEKFPPNRVYVCADRASSWRVDIPPHLRTGGAKTAHAWFVWEPGHPSGTLLGRLSKK